MAPRLINGTDGLHNSAKILEKGPSAADVAQVEIRSQQDISSQTYSSFDVQR